MLRYNPPTSSISNIVMSIWRYIVEHNINTCGIDLQ